MAKKVIRKVFSLSNIKAHHYTEIIFSLNHIYWFKDSWTVCDYQYLELPQLQVQEAWNFVSV